MRPTCALVVFATGVAYGVSVRLVERRPVAEFALGARAMRDLGLGVVGGVGLIAVVIGILQHLGTWWALLVTVALFGLAHLLLLSQMTVAGLLAIVVGGVLFTAAYVCTRRLWLSSSLHATLDFTQDAIFGVGAYHLSGVAAVGLLSARLSGPEPLTGGAFGIEASILTLVSLLAAALALLVWAKRRQRLAPPLRRHD